MSRLPTVNSDDGTWGGILNDFLSQAHNADGSLKGASVSSAGAEMTVNKDTDGTLAANSDTKYASQKAVKTYVDTSNGNNVKLTGDQTIAGAKTFTTSIKVDNGSGSMGIVGFGGALLTLLKASSDTQPATIIYAGDQSIAFGPGGSTAPDTSMKRTAAKELTFNSVKLKGVTDPTDAQDAATKTYVDTKDGNNVKLTGDQTVAGDKTFTGSLIVDGASSGAGVVYIKGDGIATTYYTSSPGDTEPTLQIVASPDGGTTGIGMGPGGSDVLDVGITRVAANEISFNSARLEDVANPVNAQDAANKAFASYPDIPYANGLHSNNLSTWFSKLDPVIKGTGVAKVLIMGDSISSIGGKYSWPGLLLGVLQGYRKTKGDGDILGSRFPTNYASGVNELMTTIGGTGSVLGAGAQSSKLANGDELTQTFSGDAITIIYGKGAAAGAGTAGGSLKIYDGPSSGTAIATIDCSGATSYSNLYDVTGLTLGSHTITIQCVGGTGTLLEQVVPHAGTLTQGIDLRTTARFGYNTAAFLSATDAGGDASTQSRALDLINNWQPDLIINALGANDLTLASYSSRTSLLYASIFARAPNTNILTVIMYNSKNVLTGDWVNSALSLADTYPGKVEVMSLAKEIGTIDKTITPYNFSTDSLHPDQKGMVMVAAAIGSRMLGDPLMPTYMIPAMYSLGQVPWTGPLTGEIMPTIVEYTASKTIPFADIGKTIYYKGSSDITVTYNYSVLGLNAFSHQTEFVQLGDGRIIIADDGTFTQVGTKQTSGVGQKLNVTMPTTLSGKLICTLVGDSDTRVSVLAAASNIYTLVIATTDLAVIVNPTADFTINIAGVPTDGQRIQLRVTSGATPYTPTWGPNFSDSNRVSLPTSYPASKTITHSFQYNSSLSKWVLWQSDGYETITNETLASPVINTGISGTAVDTDGTLAANSNTKLVSQKATKTYVDTTTKNAAKPNNVLGTQLRYDALQDWYDKLKANSSASTKLNIVVVGDSIASFAGTSWPWRLEQDLSIYASVTSPSTGYRFGTKRGVNVSYGGIDDNPGTIANNSTSGWGASMTSGQTASHTATCKSIVIVYTKQASGGTLQVYDGASLIQSIDTSGVTTQYAQTATVTFSSYASRTINITVSGGTATGFEGMYIDASSTNGVRVWNAAHAGYKSNDFTNSSDKGDPQSHGLALINTVAPDLVIIATGYNDGDDGTMLTALTDAVIAAGVPNILLISPWNKPIFGDYARTIASTRSQVATLDMNSMLGNVPHTTPPGDPFALSIDGAHPNGFGQSLQAELVLSAVTGDPIGVATTTLMRNNDANLGSINATGSLNATGNITTAGSVTASTVTTNTVAATGAVTGVNSSFSGTSNLTWSAATGKGIVGGAFGFFPGHAIWNDPTDANAAIGITSASYTTWASTLDTTTASLIFGPGGASLQDSYITRTTDGGISSSGSVRPVNAQTSSYTLVRADAGKQVTMNSSSATTITLPTNATVAIPIGSEIPIIQLGTGVITISPAGGVTFAQPNNTLTSQYTAGILRKLDTDTWVMITGGGGSASTAPRVNTLTAVSNVYTINTDTTDLAVISSPSANFTVNVSGTPTDGQKVQLRIINGATAYTPTWNGIFISSGLVLLPSAAYPVSKTNMHGFTYDGNKSKWVLTALDPAGY